MNSIEQLESVPVVKGQMRPVLSDIADITTDSLPGEYDRSGPRRFVTVSANIYNKDLGAATVAVQKTIDEMGKPPTGLVAEVRGMSSLLTETLQSLQNGLIAAIIVIFLLLAANYQSFGLAITVLCTVPAVILGAMLMLLATGSTLNFAILYGNYHVDGCVSCKCDPDRNECGIAETGIPRSIQSSVHRCQYTIETDTDDKSRNDCRHDSRWQVVWVKPAISLLHWAEQ